MRIRLTRALATAVLAWLLALAATGCVGPGLEPPTRPASGTSGEPGSGMGAGNFDNGKTADGGGQPLLPQVGSAGVGGSAGAADPAAHPPVGDAGCAAVVDDDAGATH